MYEPGTLDGFDVNSGNSASDPAADGEFGFDSNWHTWLGDSQDNVGDDTYSPSLAPEEPRDTLAEGYKTEKALERSWQQLDAKPLQQFWERGFWAEIFSDNNAGSSTALTESLGLHRPLLPFSEMRTEDSVSAEEVMVEHHKRLKLGSYMDVVSKCSIQTWQEQRDSVWETAMRRWHSCIMSWKGDDAIIAMIQNKVDFKSQCQIIVDVLHNKAPGTLLKRCNSISRLVNDLQRRDLSFPCSEEELYEHLCRQREAGAPHSRLKSLLEAVTFVRHIFGVTVLDSCTKSRRCMGVATPKEIEITKQAPPLKVEHLQAVHHVAETDGDPWNVAFAGMVLFCVYGRARWGDAQHSTKIEWDQDSDGQLCFVECATAVHKTCRALSMKHAFLPLTAPGLGVSSTNWATFWRRARADLGIDDLATFPLMPAPDEMGQATVRPLNTKEACGWLHLLLRQKVDTLGMSEPLKYTSHSFKATTLSHLAKYGCSFEDRLALGYHVDQLRMALRYSRDGASRPLRMLETCLADIRNGRFQPDETRSGRFVGSSECQVTSISDKSAGDVDIKRETVCDSTGAFSAGEVVDFFSDHATTCSESSSDDDAVVMPKHSVPPGVNIWKHMKLKTVHLSPEGYTRVLACGRKITDNYQMGGVDVRFDVIKCKQCFSSSLFQT